MDFYNRLNYSLGNEDWGVEEQALNVRINDRVICVTASGDRPLHLLLTPCSEVISIDMNPIQNYLLELKMAALRYLDYEKYLAFLGCNPTKDRMAIFNSFKSNLSSEALHYWNSHSKIIKKGIIYQGRVERFTFVASRLLNLIKRKQIKTLFSFNEIELQRAFIAETWDNSMWKWIFNVFLNPNFMKIVINDPGVIAFVEPSIKPGQYIYEKMLDYLNNHLAKKSVLLQLILTGKVLPEAYFPYLTHEGYKKIRNNISKISFKTANVIEYMSDPSHGKFDCYSMSDIASYMPQESFNQLLNSIYESANPGARFCIRKLMSNHGMPKHLEQHLKRDRFLEEKLEHEESNFVYRFITGSVIK